jgi:putative tricarboxylic transport membrane protein
MESFKLDVGGVRQPGPGFFSMLGAILLTGLSAILFLRSVFGKSERGERKKQGQKENLRTVAYLFGILLAYATLFEWLGFVLCTFLLVVFLFRMFDRKPWWAMLVTGAAISSATYVVFSILLQSELPEGVLGIFF